MFDGSDWGLLLLRIMVGGLFLWHGIAKVQTPEVLLGWFQHLKLPLPKFQAALATWGETIGGAAVLLGLGGALAPAVLTAIMAVGIKIAHWQKSPDVTKGGWEYAAVMAAASTALGLIGYGDIALDPSALNFVQSIDWPGLLSKPLGA